MSTLIIKLLNIIMAGLIAGTVFGISIGFNPKNLSVLTYVEYQQSGIKALNTLMPVLGLITIILTIIAAILQKQHQITFVTLLIAAGFLIISGLITKFGNQPINSIVMTWQKTDVPADWAELRDKWWSLHIARTVCACLAFCLIAWANLRKL